MAEKNTASNKKNGKNTSGKKKKRKSKFKKIFFIIFGLLILAAIIYIGPKLIKVHNLKKEADSYVQKSSVSTFKDSKTTIIYDSQEQQLCTMKKSKDLYYVEFNQIPQTLADAFVVMVLLVILTVPSVARTAAPTP